MERGKMKIIDTPKEVCRCRGQLSFIKDAPYQAKAKFVPQDQIWQCRICSRYYLKSWRSANIDYYTEEADYDAFFDEITADHHLCILCNGTREQGFPVFSGQPVCKKCYFSLEWSERHKSGLEKTPEPTGSELTEFLDGEYAFESKLSIRSAELLRPFAERGFSLAEIHLGELLETGPEGLRDRPAAVEYYQKAVNKCVPRAFYLLGRTFQTDDNSSDKLKNAYKFFNLGAYFGDTACPTAREKTAARLSLADIIKAQQESAQTLHNCWPGRDCRQKILTNLRNTSGQMEGELRYAEMLEGTGFQQFLLDYHESENILRKLAEDDFLPGQYELAKRLREGRTISSDFELADNLLKKAISRNYLQAIEYAWNEKASGKPVNIEFDWLSARFNGLIDYGNTAAMFIWGLINRQARGIAENPEEAWKWLNIAQFSGIRLAAPNPLEYLETRITADKCHRLFKDILRWLELHHARLAKWSQLQSLFRSRLTENRPEKWYELGILFKTGAEGFLRAPVLACGCFKLAAINGNAQAIKEIESLKRLVPEWLIDKSQHAALLMEKTGRLPSSED